MSALATAPPGAGWAPPMQLDKDAAADRTVRLVTGLMLWLGLLLVTYWWVADGGVTDLAHWESGLTSLGRLSGLWAADLLLVQVLLMSRLPQLEHAFGRDRLARIHRVVGLLSFYLMITHIVLITAGYASGQWTAVWSTIWDLITNYGGMLLAVAGTACLIMVVVTSIKAARRRLRYESWHLLHLYAYLGVGLALPHQLWTGQEFLQSPAATVYWWTLWAAAAGTDSGLAHRAAAVAQRAPSAPGRRGGSRIVRRRVGLLDRATILTGCRYWPGNSSTSDSSADRDGPAPTRSRCPSRPTTIRCVLLQRLSATAAHGWRTCGRAPGCYSRARTDASAAGPAPNERWCSPAPESASPHCAR